jgi:hypothetical protein
VKTSAKREVISVKRWERLPRRLRQYVAPGGDNEIVKNLFGFHRIHVRKIKTFSPFTAKGGPAMSKITLTGFALPLVLFFANTSGICAAQPRQSISDASTGTLEKMIVENGSVTLNLDLNGLNEVTPWSLDPSRYSSPQPRIRFFPFSFSTIYCAVPSRLARAGRSKPSRPRASDRAGSSSQPACSRKAP